MRRKRHPNKEVEAALKVLEAVGWTVKEAKGRSAHAGVTCSVRRTQEMPAVPAFSVGCRSGVHRAARGLMHASYSGRPMAVC